MHACKHKKTVDVDGALINLTVVIGVQYICVLNHYAAYFDDAQFLYFSFL